MPATDSLRSRVLLARGPLRSHPFLEAGERLPVEVLEGRDRHAEVLPRLRQMHEAEEERPEEVHDLARLVRADRSCRFPLGRGWRRWWGRSARSRPGRSRISSPRDHPPRAGTTRHDPRSRSAPLPQREPLADFACGFVVKKLPIFFSAQAPSLSSAMTYTLCAPTSCRQDAPRPGREAVTSVTPPHAPGK